MTGNVLSYGAGFLGMLYVMHVAADPQAVAKTEMLSSKEEVGVGSQLMSLPPRMLVRYVPHVPEGDVHDAVAKVTGGVRFGGTDQVVVLNIDSQQGLGPSHVLSLAHVGAAVKGATADNEIAQLPTERYSLVSVFRVFPHVVYALVTDTPDTVGVDDSISNPVLWQS